jgi:hypothetical protein
MVPFLVIVGFVVFAALAAYLSYYVKMNRRQGLALAARQLGLSFSAEDTQGCLGYPFVLLQKGDGRGTENVMWGTWQDLPMVEFDYWYYEESTDSKGGRTRTYHHLSCAVVQIAAQCAHLTLDREDVLTRIADHVGLHDIEFESEDFNRRFNVKCADRKFANDLIDARMMQWLVGVDGAFRFELSGTWVLCYSKRRGPTELVPLLGTAKQFLDHVPRVVYELYGAGAAR